MTEAARETLNDCRDALADFQYGAQGSKWRRWWVMNVTLLRAVGHVLKEVDAKRSDEHVAAISEIWNRVEASKPSIFFDFIKHERDNVLKNYRLGATQIVSVQINSAPPASQPGRTPATYDYVIHEGPFTGRNQRDLISEAIEFWSDHLDKIDARITELTQSAQRGDCSDGPARGGSLNVA